MAAVVTIAAELLPIIEAAIPYGIKLFTIIDDAIHGRKTAAEAAAALREANKQFRDTLDKFDAVEAADDAIADAEAEKKPPG